MFKYAAITIIFIIVTILIALYGFGIVSVLNSEGVISIIPIAIGIAFICLIGALAYVFIQRVKEIKEEDDDDFSKY